jgi:hypothetical protein
MKESMASSVSKKPSTYKRTRSAVMWSSIFSEPLTALYAFLPFILYKEMEATALQVAIFFMLKPVVSLFSLYWSSGVISRPERLVMNVVWGGVLARLPFFFFPWIQNTWLLLLAGAAYWMFFRGIVPAWMEILKINLPSNLRGRVFSMGAIFGYIQGVLLAVVMGPWMDYNAEAWRWLYPISAFMGILGVIFQARIPLSCSTDKVKEFAKVPLKERVLNPWRETFKLMREHKEFSRFQWGVIFCGLAIMIMKPAEPVIIESIGLSYTDLAVAILVCKGLGYVSTSALWARWLSNVNLFIFTSLVFFLVGVSYLFLMTGTWFVGGVFVCYFFYGVWLAGNHLSWNLSGTFFSSDGESCLFTSASVAMVGLRGLIGPYLGSVLLVLFGPFSALGVGVSICFISALKMARWGYLKKDGVVTQKLLPLKK